MRSLLTFVSSAALLALVGCSGLAESTTGPLGVRAQAIAEAQERFQVAPELLLALGYQQGRFEPAPQLELPASPALDPDERDHGDVAEQRYGVMFLSQAQLEHASGLVQLPVETLKADARANILAAAALLAEAAQGADLRDPAQWDGALVRFLGLEEVPAAAGLAKDSLRRVVKHGFDLTTEDGEQLTLLGEDGEISEAQQAVVAPGVYPPIQYIPAHPGNYGSRAGESVRYVVIHDMEGFLPYMISSMQNPARGTAMHYGLRASDGHIVQMVPESANAWHCGNAAINRVSIGIEHEGFAHRVNGGGYYTLAQYQSSAQLVCAIALRYGLPVDRAHIIGHGNVPSSGSGPPCSDAAANAGYCGGRNHHSDPGAYWNWNYYMGLVANCVWAATHTAPPPPPANDCGVLGQNEQLLRNQAKTSCNGRYSFVHQGDGNVVLYNNATGRALWASGTQGRATSTLVMQGDGNLVLYNGAYAVWNTRTQGNPVSATVVQDDGNVVLYGANWKVLWKTGTAGR